MRLEVELPDESVEVLVISMGAIMNAADHMEARAQTFQSMGLEAAAERWHAGAGVLRVLEGWFREKFTELSNGSSTGIPM